MSTHSLGQPQSTRSQNTAVQRLVATREEIILLSHLLQAAWVVERDNPLRRAVIAHWSLVRTALVTLVIVLSVAIGLMAPSIFRTLGL